MDKLQKEQKMIGLFMGFVMDTEDYPYKLRIPHFYEDQANPMVCGRDYSEWADSYHNEDNPWESGYCLSWDSLEFNSNWSWLMLVVKKIFLSKEYQCRTNYFFQEIEDSLLIPDITKVYKAVVNFIEWHNKNNK